jgi:hypothetical protein
MQHPSNTPSDGDFVRYVERLTASNAAVALGKRDNMLESRKKTMPPELAVVPRPAGVPAPVLTQPFRGFVFWSHVKWLVALWVATQLLTNFVPLAGFLFLPAVAAYAAWVIFKARRHSSGGLVHRVRELLAQAVHAAQKARKMQATHPKKQNEN